MPRVPTHHYADPLDRIWVSAAARMGLRVERTGSAYAMAPGDGALLLATPEHLDPDDSLAQMVLHELCHWLVQGETARHDRDWGLDNETEEDVPREHACLRLQALLAARHGLRRILAPTTEFRAFYDALGDDPLEPRGSESTELAIAARRRADGAPWHPHLEQALVATRKIAEEVAAFGEGASDLWALLDPSPPPHPSGLPPSPIARGDRTCGTCAFRYGPAGRCRQAGGARVRPLLPGCERWEAALDCQACGACCRAAYDLVQVGPRDPVRKKHPELVVARGPFLEMRRCGDRCAVLEGGRVEATFAPYTCGIYGDRPRSCRDFERGGAHCLTARRRVGLTL